MSRKSSVATSPLCSGRSRPTAARSRPTAFGRPFRISFPGLSAKASPKNNPVIGTHKTEEKSRERVLKDFELRLIWKHAGDDDHGTIIKLMMLTGQRADEIAQPGSVRDQQGGGSEKRGRTERPICQPSRSTRSICRASGRKNKRPHLVPLAARQRPCSTRRPAEPMATANLRDFVFGIGQDGFSGWSRCKERLDERIAKDLGRPLEHWRPHDLRRTMSTKMNDDSTCRRMWSRRS